MSLNIEVFDSQMNLEYGSSLQQSIKGAVMQCDFLVFVYTQDNPHIAFEAGVAVAANKPIFSLFAGGKEHTFLMDYPYVNALPTEIEKIKFAFELFLQNTFTKKESIASPASVRPHVFYGGGEIVPMKNYFDVTRRYEMAKGGSDVEFHQFQFAISFL